MGFQDIIGLLKDRTLDRIPLSDFSKNWSGDSGVTPALSTDHVTLNSKSLMVTGLGLNKKVYTSFDELDLHNQDHITLHIFSSATLEEGDLVLVLSDSAIPEIVTTSLDIPAVTMNTLKGVSIEITNPLLLSSIRSVGVQATKDLSSATIYIAAVQTSSENYNTTIAEVVKFESEGELFVLGEIGLSVLPTESDGTPNKQLQDAVYKAAAGQLWMKAWGQDAQFTDFNSNTYQKPYGVRLISDAKAICQKYLAPSGDEESNPLVVKGGSRTIS